MTLVTADGELGMTAPGFKLADPTGRLMGLDDVRGKRGTLVMFICNHCPYVKAIADRISRDARELLTHQVGVVAIMPNDYTAYPEDAPDKMAAFATTHGFTFPYLVDEAQDVAKAYGAVCTPDFFGFDPNLVLRYRGRLDESRNRPAATNTRRDLYEAMIEIAENGTAPVNQKASMGCSIKWRH